MPKVCDVAEVHKMYWISPYEFLIEGESRTSKVPYSDSFFVQSRVVLQVLQQN